MLSFPASIEQVEKREERREKREEKREKRKEKRAKTKEETELLGKSKSKSKSKHCFILLASSENRSSRMTAQEDKIFVKSSRRDRSGTGVSNASNIGQAIIQIKPFALFHNRSAVRLGTMQKPPGYHQTLLLAPFCHSSF